MSIRTFDVSSIVVRHVVGYENNLDNVDLICYIAAEQHRREYQVP